MAAVIVRGGTTAEATAVGVRRVGAATSVTTEDRWHLGSNTKAFTATMVARLVEQGRLSWETTVGQVLGATMHVHEGYRGPEGTLHMSLGDYSRFLIDQLEGERGRGRLLTVETYRRLHSDQGRPYYGLGWGVRHLDTWGAVLTHIGSNGRWYHLVWASLDHQVGIVLAANAPDSKATELAFDEVLQEVRGMLSRSITPGPSAR